jgi:hypothetical protein
MKKLLTLLALMAVVGAASADLGADIRPLQVTDKAGLQKDWIQSAFTGQKQLSGGRIKSRDGRWTVTLKPVQGLDVTSFKVLLGARELCPQALGVTFSPDSHWLFVSTGPHPFLYELARSRRIELATIDAGLESRPVWVWSWKDHSRKLVLHQQARFDKRTELRAYEVDLRI